MARPELNAQPVFSLDALTLPRIPPDRIIRCAALAGFDSLSLPVQPPYVYSESLVTPANFDVCWRELKESDIDLKSLEFFVLGDSVTTESYRPALELGARLGGQVALAINLATENESQAAEQLADFCRVAGDYGLGVNIEPVSTGKTMSLEQGRRLILASGCGVGLVVDCLHLMRVGGSVDSIRAIDPQLIRHVQICDGLKVLPEDKWLTESIAERLYPGKGEFPLKEIIKACPADALFAIEAPRLQQLSSGVSPEKQVCEAFDSLRTLFRSLQVSI